VRWGGGWPALSGGAAAGSLELLFFYFFSAIPTLFLALFPFPHLKFSNTNLRFLDLKKNGRKSFTFSRFWSRDYAWVDSFCVRLVPCVSPSILCHRRFRVCAVVCVGDSVCALSSTASVEAASGVVVAIVVDAWFSLCVEAASLLVFLRVPLQIFFLSFCVCAGVYL
jgi:hypothetical protein